MIRSSVCTARTGWAPIAVSPASMIASTRSSTALAASLTSARVGRGSVRIDSSTCVATITGIAKRAGAPRHFLLHARHALERQLEAEIAARDHHRVALAKNLVEPRHGLRPFELRDERDVRGARLAKRVRAPGADRSPRCTKTERHEIDASGHAELQIGDVLSVSGHSTAAPRPAR